MRDAAEARLALIAPANATPPNMEGHRPFVEQSAEVILSSGEQQQEAHDAESVSRIDQLARQIRAAQDAPMQTDAQPQRGRSAVSVRQRPASPTDLQPTNAVGQPTYNSLRVQSESRERSPRRQPEEREMSMRRSRGATRVPTAVPAEHVQEQNAPRHPQHEQISLRRARASSQGPPKRHRGPATSVAPRDRRGPHAVRAEPLRGSA